MATIAFRVSDILCDDMSVVSASLFRVVCSSTQLNVVNWVLQRMEIGSAHVQTSNRLKSHK